MVLLFSINLIANQQTLYVRWNSNKWCSGANPPKIFDEVYKYWHYNMEMTILSW